MGYLLDPVRVIENHQRFLERQKLYRERGLDHIEHRERLLDRLGFLNGRILETGSGRGYLALALARKGYRFLSVDLEREMLDSTTLNLVYEKLLGQVTLCLADVNRLCFRNDSFDWIIAVDFFHHIENVERAAVEMDRVLKPGGRVVISDFNSKGREIVSAVHREDGREHIDYLLPPVEAGKPFVSRGYDLQYGEDECHWFFTARKRSNEPCD